MNITITLETQTLLEEQMKKRRFSTPDDAVRTALQSLETAEGVDIEQLDAQTQAALDRAFAQSERGEGRPWEEVRAELQKKYPPI
ncbi:MAG TPA: Mpv17/PMP22 family protein [Tepidisphaeraceae bacterium]|nr:Mpv17/PMP22 family protein [Tepidisphaeraceae bacterium]